MHEDEYVFANNITITVTHNPASADNYLWQLLLSNCVLQSQIATFDMIDPISFVFFISYLKVSPVLEKFQIPQILRWRIW